MRAAVHCGIQSVDKSTWNYLTMGHSFAGWEWCRYGETILGEENAYYVVVSSDDEPIAGAMFFVRFQEQLPLHNRVGRKLLETYLARRPLLISRTPPVTKSMGVFLPADETLRSEALTHIRRVAIEIARERGVSFILFDYLPTDRMHYDWGNFLKLEGFLEAGTQLCLPYESWDTYMQSVRARSKNAYKDIRRHLNKGQELGVEVTFFPSVTNPDEALRLIHNVDAKYDEYPLPNIDKVLTNSAMLNGGVTWMAAHLGEKLVACELIFYDAQTGVCSPTLYGRDYDYDYTYLYTYYQVIRYAIEQLNARILRGDSGAYEFKYRLGFELSAHNNFVFHSPRLFERTIANWLLA